MDELFIRPPTGRVELDLSHPLGTPGEEEDEGGAGEPGGGGSMVAGKPVTDRERKRGRTEFQQLFDPANRLAGQTTSPLELEDEAVGGTTKAPIQDKEIPHYWINRGIIPQFA